MYEKDEGFTDRVEFCTINDRLIFVDNHSLAFSYSFLSCRYVGYFGERQDLGVLHMKFNSWLWIISTILSGPDVNLRIEVVLRFFAKAGPVTSWPRPPKAIFSRPKTGQSCSSTGGRCKQRWVVQLNDYARNNSSTIIRIMRGLDQPQRISVINRTHCQKKKFFWNLSHCAGF